MNWLILIIITALSPHWDAHMNFRLSVPELCLIRFCVRDQTGLLSSDFVGQYTLPFTSLKKGEPHGRKEGEGVGDWESDEELNYIRWHCVAIFVFPFLHTLSITDQVSDVFIEMLPHIYTVLMHLAAIFTFLSTSSFLRPPPGYRWVPLRSRDGCSLDPASLFVFVWYS